MVNVRSTTTFMFVAGCVSTGMWMGLDNKALRMRVDVRMW